MPPEYYPRENLLQQASILEDLADEGDVDPATVAQAQAALERDIAWLARFSAGETSGGVEETEVDPTSAEAARVLIQLLLGDQG